MKVILVVLLALFLSGCFGRDTQPSVEVVYEPIFPPATLLQPCLPERPERASLRDIIEIQHRALLQCDGQLEALRDWRELERGQQEEEEEE